MNYKKFFTLIVFIIFAMIGSGCNLPDAAQKTASSETNSSTTESMEDLVKTAQANIPVISDTAEPAIEKTDSEDLLISSEAETELPAIEKQTEAELPAAEKQAEAELPVDKDQSEPEVIPTPTSDPNRKPPELPAVFQTDLLNVLDTPHTYEEDICKVIKNRWGTGKAAPGTVVMAIMYHGIVKGDTVSQDNAITVDKHKQLIRNLHDQGFTAINTEQFIAFMENNEWIPERSVLLIVDDRHTEQNYIDHFKEYYDEWGWPVINAWISADGTSATLWNENAHAEEIGLVDHQAHGVVHNENMSDASTDEFLIGELKGSVDAIEEHFHKTPRAIIWPGGGFGRRPIEFAKEFGYKVGFTTHPRGPVMYNWVPLCDVNDEARPYYMVDGNQDPLFVIPRYWDTDASEHVDTVRQIGKAAKEYYEASFAAEIEYYDIVCKPVMGDL